MTPAEKNEAIAELISDYKQAKEKISLVTGKLNRIGEEFVRVGQLLVSRPELVGIEGQSYISVEYQDERQDFKPSLFDAGKIKNLTAELRDVLSKRAKLEPKIKDLGL